MKLISTLTSFILIFIFNISFSQGDLKPSLIIKNKKDTIYGLGNISKNHEYCLFKKFDAKEYKKYRPEEIDAFRVIDGKYYVSKQIEELNGKIKWYFLEFLVDGEIDLYTITNSGRFFIKKENEDYLELNDNINNNFVIDGNKYLIQDKRYLGYIRFYMADTPELFPEINKIKKLNQRDLVKLSMKYHDAVCNEYECVNYTKNIPDVTYKIEVLSGVTYHNNYYAPLFGVLVHIWRPLKNEKLYLKTGIIYSDKPYIKKRFFEQDQGEHSIKLPISFQYEFGKKAFKPTIAIGYPTGIYLLSSFQCGFIYSLSKSFELSLSGSIDGLLGLPYDQHEYYFNNDLGHTISFGLIYKL